MFTVYVTSTVSGAITSSTWDFSRPAFILFVFLGIVCFYVGIIDGYNFLNFKKPK